MVDARCWLPVDELVNQLACRHIRLFAIGRLAALANCLASQSATKACWPLMSYRWLGGWVTVLASSEVATQQIATQQTGRCQAGRLVNSRALKWQHRLSDWRWY